MRFIVCFLLLGLAGCATTAPVTTYTDPAAGADGAVLIREACLGQGRGMIHFQGVDSTEFETFQVQKLSLSPGEHTVRFKYMAPGFSYDITGEGATSIRHSFEPGVTYIARYRRTEPKRYKVWLEPIDAARAAGPDWICLQPAFEDRRYWQ